MSEFPPLPGSTASDIDLYCLEYGYNLRGLSGDPRRCPECGHLNPMGDLELPAAEISKQLRLMESNPAYCVLICLLAAFPGVFLGLLIWDVVIRSNRPDRLLAEAMGYLGPILVALMGLWVFCASRFRRSCRARPGWAAVLFTYHVYAIALSLGVVGLLILPGGVGFGCYTLGFGVAACVAAGVISLVLGVAAIAILAVLAHRRLKSLLTPLQRDLAVQIARDTLRKRLSRRHSGW